MRRFLAVHFDGVNPYDEAIHRNLNYLTEVLSTHDFGRLRREPKVFVPAAIAKAA